jgi:hypothetical protein
MLSLNRFLCFNTLFCAVREWSGDRGAAKPPCASFLKIRRASSPGPSVCFLVAKKKGRGERGGGCSYACNTFVEPLDHHRINASPKYTPPPPTMSRFLIQRPTGYLLGAPFRPNNGKDPRAGISTRRMKDELELEPLGHLGMSRGDGRCAENVHGRVEISLY